jgi:esterase/lipase superfamily enzyme
VVPSDVERVLVSTIRQEADGQPIFTSERAANLTFADFAVSVPPARSVGSVTFADSYSPDPRTDFYVVSGRRLGGEQAFVAEINRRLRSDPLSDNTNSVFIHGYNTNFAEGLYRHAQLQHDYDSHAATVLFSWPSAGSNRGYVYDHDSALCSRGALESTLAAMARSNATKINIIAHSMGCFLTMETLSTMARAGHGSFFDKLNAVLLVAPDTDVDVFRTQARPVLSRGVPIFVVVSSRDRALLVSARIRGNYRRVGDATGPTFDALEEPCPLEQNAHVAMQLGQPEADAAVGETGAHLLKHRCSGRVDLGSGARVENHPAGVHGCRICDDMQPRLDMLGVEEQEVALDEGDSEAGYGPCVRPVVKLVETVSAGHATEHRIVGIHHLVQEVGEGCADRDENAVQYPKADGGEQRDHRKDELHPADAPDPTQGVDVYQADRGGDQDGAERRDRLVLGFW